MILVTGGAGFIGTVVCRELEVRGVEPKVVDLPAGDVRSTTGMRRAVKGCDGVIHLAGVLGTHELFDRPRLAIDVNIVGTLNVLEACRDHNARYVGITMPQVFPSVYTATVGLDGTVIAQNDNWETASNVALIPGIVAAPIFYAYLKQELVDSGLV
mgnify:CR=1 FL=1